jgi:hypothetical protein
MTTAHVYRLYLTSTSGIQNDGSVYNVTFTNIQLPTSHLNRERDKWYVAAEGFSMTESVAVPFTVVTDLPIVDAASNTQFQAVPLCLAPPGFGVMSSPVNVNAIGLRLASPPERILQSGSITVRVTALDGTTLPNTANQGLSQEWSPILAIYRH